MTTIADFKNVKNTSVSTYFAILAAVMKKRSNDSGSISCVLWEGSFYIQVVA